MLVFFITLLFSLRWKQFTFCILLWWLAFRQTICLFAQVCESPNTNKTIMNYAATRLATQSSCEFKQNTFKALCPTHKNSKNPKILQHHRWTVRCFSSGFIRSIWDFIVEIPQRLRRRLPVTRMPSNEKRNKRKHIQIFTWLTTKEVENKRGLYGWEQSYTTKTVHAIQP